MADVCPLATSSFSGRPHTALVRTSRRLSQMNVREDLEFRGLLHQVTDDAVFTLLDAGAVTFYAGFDPTAPSLHLGHLFPLCNLRRLQMAGNRPIALAGGGTGLIGDPSFKDSERPLLSREQLDENGRI